MASSEQESSANAASGGASSNTSSSSSSSSGAGTPGKGSQTSRLGGGGSAVNRALGQQGSGMAHTSGATMHTDAAAQSAASELGAKAFTAGNDVYFGAGQYQPQTAKGQGLIQHEVTHVQQSKAAAPPQPGNYRLSSANDLAEKSARTAASGGAATAASSGDRVIYRDLLDGIADVLEEAYDDNGGSVADEFLQALAAGDKATAVAKWAEVPSLLKSQIQNAGGLAIIGRYPPGLPADPVEAMLRVIGPDAIAMLGECGVSVGHQAYVDIILDDHANAAAWLAALNANLMQWMSFMLSLPGRDTVTQNDLPKLNAFMTALTTDGETRYLFEHIYPALHDTPYSTTFLSKAWTAPDTKRLFDVLAMHVPVAHVMTISGGFYLGTHKVNSDGTTTPLGYGWYNSAGRVVMPAKPGYTGTSTGHGMVGGATAVGGAGGPSLDHFDSTALHEIGHGVGAHSDGNSWAESYGDWQKHGQGSWSQQLFDDAAMQAHVDAEVAAGTLAEDDVLPPGKARDYMAKKVAGQDAMVVTWSGWIPTVWDDANIDTFLDTYYNTQPLYTYYKAGTPDYEATASNIASGRMYVYLSRYGDSYSSYKRELWDNRVSSYSMSSPKEWFAEQYSEYYRVGRAQGNLQPDVKVKMDELDTMKWDDDTEDLQQAGPADDNTPLKQWTAGEILDLVFG